MIDVRMLIAERELPLALTHGFKFPFNRRALLPLAGLDILQIRKIGLQIRKIGREDQFQSNGRTGERVVDHMDILVVAASDIGVDLDFDAFLHDLTAARIRIALWSALAPCGRANSGIADAAVRFDGIAGRRLNSLALNMKLML